MTKIKNIESDYAILDVMKGRKKLAKHFEPHQNRMGPVPEGRSIPVLIVGRLTGIQGNDDGISQEFTVNVETLLHLQPGDASYRVTDGVAYPSAGGEE